MAADVTAAAGDPTRPVNIAFVGAGAVGCFYASRLHHPIHNIYVSLIARSNYAVLARSGVKMLTHSFGDYTFTPAAVFPSVPAAAPRTPSSPPPDTAAAAAAAPGRPPGHWDYVIVTTKALPDRVDDSATIAPLVTPGRTCIVLIQNGVGVEHPHRARFPANPVVSAVTVVSAALVDPGTVRQNRWTRLYLGPYVDSASAATTAASSSSSSSSSPHPSSQLDRQALLSSGASHVCTLSRWFASHGRIRDVEPHEAELSLQLIRWHKLVINAAFNPSSVLSGGLGNADMLLSSPELRRHIGGLMGEIFAAAPLVLGAPFPEGLARPEKIMASTERNRGAKPSMLLDWEAGRPLELEVIVGNPVRIARSRGVEMPRLQSVYALLKSMQDVRDRKMEEVAKEKL